VGGMPATVQYAGGVPGQVAGLMQITVQIPDGVPPGGYVPVGLQVGDRKTTANAVWIAVGGSDSWLVRWAAPLLPQYLLRCRLAHAYAIGNPDPLVGIPRDVQARNLREARL
jgi:hypothetical protein